MIQKHIFLHKRVDFDEVSFFFFQGAKQLKWEMERDNWIKGKNKTFRNKKQGMKRKPSFKSGHKNIKKRK